MTTKITDLPEDAISLVLSSVAKSSDGAADIARSMSVCKSFLESAKNNIVFKAVCFQNVDVMKKYHLLQRTAGLLYSCATAGNLPAQILLAKVILLSSHKLMQGSIEIEEPNCFRENTRKYFPYLQEDYEAASFLASFTPGKGPRPFLFHWELIKIFLSNCTERDIFNMRARIWNYVVYFTGCPDHRVETDFNMFDNSVVLLHHLDVYASDFQMGIERRKVFAEEERMMRLYDFDCICRHFPGFVVTEED